MPPAEAPRHPVPGLRLAALFCAASVAAVVVSAAVPRSRAQTPGPTTGSDPVAELRRQIEELQATMARTQAQREQVLAELDEDAARVADLDTQVAQAGVEVARAESEVLSTASRLTRSATELYKNPSRQLGLLLDATSLNDLLVARKYLTVQTGAAAVTLGEVQAAREAQTARRDELAARRAELATASEQKQQRREIVEASVENEAGLLAQLQEKLAIAQASHPGAFGDLPPATVEDCPGSGAGSVGGNPAKNAKQAALYARYPFGPVAGIPPGFEAVGPATVEVHSWYGKCFHGHSTASGAVYDQNLFTAAALKYPLGTFLVVTYPPNGASMLVLINDRGPYVKGRTLDLSAAGAYYLGTADRGVATVTAQVVRPTY